MAEIKTRPATPEYRENWDKIFGRKDLTEKSLEDLVVEINKMCVDRGELIAIRPTLAHFKIGPHA